MPSRSGIEPNEMRDELDSGAAPEPAQPERRLTRRTLLAAGFAGVGAIAGASYLASRLTGDGKEALRPAPAGSGGDTLAELARNVTSGGPPKDGIPSIDEPKFVAAGSARFLADDDVVFGLELGGEARAYPQLVLVWHEIVNDKVGGRPISVTYCPLTGSTVAFRGTSARGEALTFGTSGDLVNSNLLMYDRETDSRWPQILGQAIVGPSRGRRLEEIPLQWTTWRHWRRAHPDTRVLSTDTGFLRNYGDDPYGSYNPLGGYYKRSSSDLFFPVLNDDSRFPRKDVFVGAKLAEVRLAVRKDVVRRERAVMARMGRSRVAFLHDPDLDDVRAYRAHAGGRALLLAPGSERGRYVDEATGSVLDARGGIVSGPLRGSELERVTSYDVMWFAWAAFFRDSKVLG